MDESSPDELLQQALSRHRAEGIEPKVVAWDLHEDFAAVAFVHPVSHGLRTDLLKYSSQYKRWFNLAGGGCGGGPSESPARYSRPSFSGIRLDTYSDVPVRDHGGHETHVQEACGFVGPSIDAVGVEVGEEKARVVPVRTDAGLFVILSLGIQDRRLFAVDSDGARVGDAITIPRSDQPTKR